MKNHLRKGPRGRQGGLGPQGALIPLPLGPLGPSLNFKLRKMRLQFEKRGGYRGQGTQGSHGDHRRSLGKPPRADPTLPSRKPMCVCVFTLYGFFAEGNSSTRRGLMSICTSGEAKSVLLRGSWARTLLGAIGGPPVAPRRVLR